MTTSLPILSATPGNHETCRWKCGNDCFRPVPNRSGNEPFRSVVERGISRRSFLKAGIAATVVLGTAGGVLTATERAVAQTTGTAPPGQTGRGFSFRPIEPSVADRVIVPRGYDHDLLIRWGDPVTDDAPRFDFDHQTAAAQAQQFGYNCDYITYFPSSDVAGGNRFGILWVNHEYTNPELMFAGYDADNPTREQVDVEMAAHGGSTLQIRRWNGDFRGYNHQVRGHRGRRRATRYNRRITAETPMLLTGPAAGADLLKTGEDPTGLHVRGMLNNCSGGHTPWGTVLTGEENFNQYFAYNDEVADTRVRELHERYGLPDGESDRKWERYHPRFDLRAEPHEPFRFGWVVEIDPYDPDFTPRKRTAMGRFKHEGAANIVAGNGHVVVYLGDDERFDYIYKFVSAGTYREGDRAHNLTLLDEGTLYVARFDVDTEGNGIGQWLPLVHGQGPLTAANGFSSQADVVINARGAGDVLGATPMDRPEDVEANPVTGAVYAMLTNNTQRQLLDDPETPRDQGVNRANPRPDNQWGHVIEWVEDGGDHTATTFRWSIFMLCGDPDDPSTYFAGFPKDQVSPIANPDNVLFDRQGNMWLATDGQPNTIGPDPDAGKGWNDAFHAVPVGGDQRGHVEQFLSVPRGAEATGPELTPDNQTLFCAVQHPGEGGVLGSSEKPPLSDWPDRGGRAPRPSVITIYKGNVGTSRRIGS